MFRDAHSDARTDACTHQRTGQNHASGHITLGGDTKITAVKIRVKGLTQTINRGFSCI